MALDDIQWPCIECRIKEEHFKTYRADLESRIHGYKRKYLLSHALIEKYREKCIECENLYQQLEKCVGMLANYKWRMGCALRTTFPMRSTLKETRDELVSVQSQLISESEAHYATHQLSTQLQGQILKLEEKISQLERNLEESKGTAKNLQQQLRSFTQAKLNLKNKRERLKLVHKGVQVEANKINTFRQDLGSDASEDEGVSSLDRASICSPLDNQSNSIADVFMDVAVSHSSEMPPEGHTGVCSKEKSKKLHINKKSETSKPDVLKDTSFHNQAIADLDTSSAEDGSLPKRQKENKQNGIKTNDLWSLHSDMRTKGEKYENQTSEFDPADYKDLSDKILPLPDPSAKRIHLSTVDEKPLISYTEQQKSVPLLIVPSTDNEDHEMLSLPSMFIENQHSSLLNELQFKNHTYMECENILQTDDILVEKPNCSLQSNSLLSPNDTNNLTLEETEVTPFVGISSTECENSLHSNSMLKGASKQNAPKEKINPDFDALEVRDCALQTKLKLCPLRTETLNETDTVINEKLKKPKALLLAEYKDKHMIDATSLSADDFTEDLLDNVLQEMSWQYSLVSPLSNLTSAEDEMSSCKENVSCSVAVGTEHLVCDVGMQTTEEYLQKKPVKLHDVVIQTENVVCSKETQTHARDQGLHNKNNLLSVAAQTEVHDMHASRARHALACSVDSLSTVDGKPSKTMCADRKNNTVEAFMNPEINEPLNCASCNINQLPQWPGQFDNEIKESCRNMLNVCPGKYILEQNVKLLALHQQHLQLTVKMMEQQNNMLAHSQALSNNIRMSPVINCTTDQHFRDHYIKTSKRLDNKNAKLSTSSEPFQVNSLHTCGACFCCNNNLTIKKCSKILDSNNSIIQLGNFVEPKHENTDETSEELICRDNSSRNCAHDREENMSEWFENKVQDFDRLFGFVSDLSSDDEKSSCKASFNNLSLRKRAAESDDEALAEHTLPVKKMKKHRFKRIWVASSDEDDFITTKNIENNKSAFKTATHGGTTLKNIEENKPPVKITLQCYGSDEDELKSIPSKAMLKVAQTLKKKSKISKLERMRLNIVKEKTRVKIPRASPERVRQRLKKSVAADAQVSAPTKRPREVKKLCVSPNSAHSLPSVLEATKIKISPLVPSHMNDYENAEVRQIADSSTVAPAKLSTESSAIHTFKMNTVESVSVNPSLPLDVQDRSQSTLSSTAPEAISAYAELKTSHLLHRTDLESTKYSQTRDISGSNKVAIAKLLAKSSFQKLEANAELTQPSSNTCISIPLNTQRVNVNDQADSTHHTEPKQDEKLSDCRSSSNTQSKTLDSLSNRLLCSPLVVAASPQKVNESELNGSTGKSEQNCLAPISNAQNKIQETEKDNESLSRGCAVQWALKLLRKEAEQERKKNVTLRDCSKIQLIIRKALKELESETFDKECLAFIVQELANINKAYVVDLVARRIVKAVETDISSVDKTHTPPAPPLTVLQQRLMALTFTLHYEHQMFKELPEKILLAIEYKTLRLGAAPKMQECQKLVCFYSAVCRALKDVKRIQLYCLDALYSLHYKSAPILNAVLCTFPEALPHADKGKDIPLVKCLVFLIFTPVQYKKRSFSVKPLKDLLHQLYGYDPEEFNADQLLSFLLGKLRNEENKEVPIALILLAKRMPHNWAYKTLLCKNLIPLVNEWKAAKLQNSAFAKILPVMGYIVRCFPIGESRAFIEKIKYIFISIMEDENAPAEVQEGAVMGLLSLSRHNPSHIAGLLKKWQPKMKLSNKVVHKIAAFLQFKPLKFWTYYVSS